VAKHNRTWAKTKLGLEEGRSSIKAKNLGVDLMTPRGKKTRRRRSKKVEINLILGADLALVCMVKKMGKRSFRKDHVEDRSGKGGTIGDTKGMQGGEAKVTAPNPRNLSLGAIC